MKKKRFYKNVKRNVKWTEEEKGYPIDFADKYVSDEGIYSDKFDYMRPKIKKKRKHKAQARTLFKRLGIAVLCLLIVGIGYTGMDVFMLRNGMPKMDAAVSAGEDSVINEVRLDLNCAYEDSISMDGSVMLESVCTRLTDGAYNSVAIDLKRADGTIGYKSSLATVDAYSATAFEASDLHGSVTALSEQDILTVGVVYCYLDNLLPRQDRSVALLNNNGVPYEDSRGNTYLNPASQTVYKYIKDIIAEAAEMGVSVFVLRATDVPADGVTGDGFDSLAARLYEDIGTDMKLLEGIDVEISDQLARSAGTDESTSDENAVDPANSETDGESEESTAADANSAILALFDAKTDNSKIYIVSVSENEAQIKNILEEGGIESFILDAEQL